MRIYFHSGTGTQLVRSVQMALAGARDTLLAQGVLFPDGLGAMGQSDLFVAALAPSEGHPILSLRGLIDAVDAQDFGLRARSALARQIVQHRPRALILSLPEAAVFCDTAARLSALRAVLSEFSDDILPVLHLAAPAEALADAFHLHTLLGAVAAPVAAKGTIGIDPDATVALWAEVFGAETLTAREFGPAALTAKDVAIALGDLGQGGLPARVAPNPRPSLVTLRRALRLNAGLAGAEAASGPIPFAIREKLLAGLGDAGRGVTGADLAALTAHIRTVKGAKKTAPDLSPDPDFDPAPLLIGVAEAAAAARQAADAARVQRLTAQGAASTARAVAAPQTALRRKGPEPLTKAGETILSATAKEVHRSFAGGRYWPRNTGVVGFDETADLPPFPVDTPPKTGTLIVGCMKNEGPYILEWVAYHKAIGVDHFLIYTNDCTDGTDEILIRLMELGHLTHVSNNEWKGKSPQQAALNKAMKLDVVKQADWLIHIDIDEYINVRMGNGTLADLYAGMGDATNLAMTWRLFGNAGQEDIGAATVIDRFTGCAPSYVPKPHTMWGFKSITRNVGAYSKLSCHRPNKVAPKMKDQVRWLNGNLQDHSKELTDKGWRSSIQSIGYDAVQLNHYALRSRESFLIKRQRGRALHVDRSIGLNYWVRHDWHLNTDRSILRQVPRTWAMKAKLLEDPVLAKLHADALAWHLAKAAELRATEAFAELWEQTKTADLSDGERMAYAVAEDMES
ncbi:MAG: glycosyl transferase family 2 [Rhodobacteraceae bacterium PARR1]|nr:MAG: glycosyl transferase family 2 [Rhodobacteraceae bacterium PARR1]